VNSEEQLRLISNTIEDVFWITDWETRRTVYVSPAYEQVWQRSVESLYESVSGWADAIHPDDRARAWESFVNLPATGQYDEEYRVVLPSGGIRFIRDRGYPVLNDEGEVSCAVGIAQDITEAKAAEREKEELQARLLQTQKMDAIATLAGGIAHDLNHILSGVYSFAELAQRQVPEGSAVLDSLKEIVHGAERAKDLTRQILTFRRKREHGRVQVDLRSTIGEVLRFLRPTLPSTIEVRAEIKARAAWILADPNQMQQVLINLGTNAAAAMREKGGVLELILDEVAVEGESATSGRCIKLSVRDSGSGISAAALDHIFKPFYTTKEAGEGTGLGLSIVHSIVTDHGGTISVDSSPDEWTAFTILLPKIEGPETGQRAVSETCRRGAERILYVDDERLITRANKKLLEELGYHVEATNSSLHALEIFRSQSDEFDVLITDQTMPGLTGDELVREVLTIRRDIPVILCTGFSDKIDGIRARSMGIHTFLTEPVSMVRLTEAIGSIFDRNPEAYHAGRQLDPEQV
jgi:PAS domain S-box-containing protein|tara:strand:- start:19757 stop:21322 length:1566 start_codon:yes stop_codon:yes gene_type:complete